jgi:hypothetical protein
VEPIRHPGGATTIEPVHKPQRNREPRRPEAPVHRPEPGRALTSEAESRLRICRRSPGSSDCQDLRCELRQPEALRRATRDRLRLRLPRDRLLRSLWPFGQPQHRSKLPAWQPNTHWQSSRQCRTPTGTARGLPIDVGGGDFEASSSYSARSLEGLVNALAVAIDLRQPRSASR